MADHSPKDKLLAAARLVEEAMTSIRVESRTCAGCGRPHHSSWHEHNTRERLEGIVEKIRRVAGGEPFTTRGPKLGAGPVSP